MYYHNSWLGRIPLALRTRVGRTIKSIVVSATLSARFPELPMLEQAINYKVKGE
jgi:hypothetical protein